MLDPDWSLPAQNWCRGAVVNDPACTWRGDIGKYWGSDCSIGTQWAQFFAGYSAAVVYYAHFAASNDVDVYLLSHELLHATEVCPDLWANILAAVRAVFGGKVSTAFNPDGPEILPPQV
jgi:hypothetical protein